MSWCVCVCVCSTPSLCKHELMGQKSKSSLFKHQPGHICFDCWTFVDVTEPSGSLWCPPARVPALLQLRLGVCGPLAKVTQPLKHLSASAEERNQTWSGWLLGSASSFTSTGQNRNLVTWVTVDSPLTCWTRWSSSRLSGPWESPACSQSRTRPRSRPGPGPELKSDPISLVVDVCC